ncbi:MAG TPA: ABC transporter substrate-binding protein [Candidatus Omnitrophica bacterium]|nr:ABC transporter substrate-binding protein [Candidatus Omnitrophota bacterium]
MKRWTALIFFIFLAFLASYLFLYSIKHEAKNIIPERIERIVSLNVAATEILLDLGLKDKIVGVSFSGSNPEAVKDKPKVGKGFGNVNVEKVLALRPDIVFAYKGDASVLKEKGIPVFVVDTSNLEEVISLIKDIGKAVGKGREAYKIVKRMRDRIDEIRRKLKDVKFYPLVYFEAGSPGYTRGRGSLTHDLIALAGGKNLARNEPVVFPILSQEYIIAENPDIIVAEEYGAKIEEIKKRDGWQNIKAVRNNRIYKAPVYFTNYTPRCIEGLEQFARWFHSEVFNEN